MATTRSNLQKMIPRRGIEKLRDHFILPEVLLKTILCLFNLPALTLLHFCHLHDHLWKKNWRFIHQRANVHDTVTLLFRRFLVCSIILYYSRKIFNSETPGRRLRAPCLFDSSFLVLLSTPNLFRRLRREDLIKTHLRLAFSLGAPSSTSNGTRLSRCGMQGH